MLPIQTAQDDDFAICFISICCIFKLLRRRLCHLLHIYLLHIQNAQDDDFAICFISMYLLHMQTAQSERDGQAYFYQHAAYVPLGTLPHATRVSKN
jgi:hypothetical protein